MLCATFDVTHISRGHNDAMRSVLDTVQDFLIKLGIKPRMHLLMGKQDFITKYCHVQTYQNYEQKLGTFLEKVL